MKQNLFHEHCISIHDADKNKKDKIGIGFIVSEKDDKHFIITCKHVITCKDAVEGSEKNLEINSEKFEEIECCDEKDIVLIEAGRINHKEPVTIQKGIAGNLVVATYDKATNGTSLVFKNIAVEVSEKTTISEGSEDYSAYRLEVTDENDKIEAGHSGSPVFDVTTGCVVGFISLKGESEAYAIAIENIIGLTGDELIEEIDISYLEKIESYLKSKIDSETLKSTAKTYLEPLYQRELASKTTRRDIIDYLDNHDKNPLYCVVKELFKDDDDFIKEWLKKNAHTECKKVVTDEEEFEDRIVVDFEPVAGSKSSNIKYNIYINYHVNGRFKANKEPIFKNKILKDDNSIQKFKVELLNILYDEIEFYEHIDFILSKELLLLDIKLWNIEDEVNYIEKCFVKNIKINFHIRERLDFRDKFWNPYKALFNVTINEAFTTMNHPKDKKCIDSSKIGLKYFFTPALYENFYDRVNRKPIAIRCANEDDLEKYIDWLNSKNTILVKDLKREIDKEECECITLIWDDPNIPLKPKEGVTQ